MGLYLLTGAGFTRNWGGWLANEAFEYLIGCSGMTPRVARLLWQAHKTGGGFEAVYQQLYDESRTGVIPPAQFEAFHQMVAGMFHTMQIGLRSAEFLGMYVMILARFDEIYTLNQDTFLELNYMNWNIREASQGRFFGVDCPGLRPVDTTYEPPGLFVEDQHGEFAVRTRHQPYYKLHGSSNWKALGTTDLMLILGGNKESNIQKSALLSHYFSCFEKALITPDSRVMIVGYSFNDDHVNRRLFDAARTGTKFFIVDPRGTDLIEERGQQLIERNLVYLDKIAVFKDAIVGASRRPLPSSLYGDNVERTKIMRFLG